MIKHLLPIIVVITLLVLFFFPSGPTVTALIVSALLWERDKVRESRMERDIERLKTLEEQNKLSEKHNILLTKTLDDVSERLVIVENRTRR
jgi:hypothetical protein